MSAILRMSYGSELQAVGPVTENARSPSFDLVGYGAEQYMTDCLRMSVVSVVEMRQQQCSEQCC